MTAIIVAGCVTLYLAIGMTVSATFYHARHRRIFSGKMRHYQWCCNCELSLDYDTKGVIKNPWILEDGRKVALHVGKLKQQWRNHLVATVWKTVLLAIAWPVFIPIFVVGPQLLLLALAAGRGVDKVWNDPIRSKDKELTANFVGLDGKPLSAEKLLKVDQLSRPSRR